MIDKVDKNTIFAQIVIANCSQHNSHEDEMES